MTENSIDVAVLSRHSLRGEDSPYPGISAAGAEKARERARGDLRELVEKSPPGAVMFIGGASEEIRTKSTAEVYGDELNNIFEGREDTVVITKSTVEELVKQGDSTMNEVVRAVRAVAGIVNSNPDKKIIVDYPLFLKEFERQRFLKPETWHNKREVLPFYIALVKKAQGNEDDEFLRQWFISRGKITDPDTGEELIGPNPDIVAVEYLRGLGRLRDFARKHIGKERPLVLVVVGHTPSLDAFITHFASPDKRANPENLETVNSGKMLVPAEITQIDLGKSGPGIPPPVARVTYRGRTFQAV